MYINPIPENDFLQLSHLLICTMLFWWPLWPVKIQISVTVLFI